MGNIFPADIYGVFTALPFIGPLTASSNTVTAGSSLTLTARNISDRDLDTITQVSCFYFDSTGANQVVGTVTQTSTGAWTLTVKANLAPGICSLYAQAQESDGLFGPAVALVLTVQLGSGNKRPISNATAGEGSRPSGFLTGPSSGANAARQSRRRPGQQQLRSRHGPTRRQAPG
jgi:hypothetical protein